MRLVMLVVGALMVASVSAVSAQDADEAWCAGLADYVRVQAGSAATDAATDAVRTGCIDYLRENGGPPSSKSSGDVDAVTLSDAATIWCAEHDNNQNHGGWEWDSFDVVAEAAIDLGIPVPQPLVDYNNAFRLSSFTDWTELIPEEVVSDYFDWDLSGGRRDWRASEGYARACLAAYELRDR